MMKYEFEYDKIYLSLFQIHTHTNMYTCTLLSISASSLHDLYHQRPHLHEPNENIYT